MLATPLPTFLKALGRAGGEDVAHLTILRAPLPRLLAPGPPRSPPLSPGGQGSLQGPAFPLPDDVPFARSGGPAPALSTSGAPPDLALGGSGAAAVATDPHMRPLRFASAGVADRRPVQAPFHSLSSALSRTPVVPRPGRPSPLLPCGSPLASPSLPRPLPCTTDRGPAATATLFPHGIPALSGPLGPAQPGGCLCLPASLSGGYPLYWGVWAGQA